MAPAALTPPTSPGRRQPTIYEAEHASQDISTYSGYDHVHWWVGNAKQAASFYVTRMGFSYVAYRGLETGSRSVASHVVRNGKVTFVLTSPLRGADTSLCEEDQAIIEQMHKHQQSHGDAVKDVAFTVDNVEAVYAAAVKNCAVSIAPPKTLTDQYGTVKLATIKTYGDTTHTLVERQQYSGPFMPGFRSEQGRKDPIAKYLPNVSLETIDHCVGNQDWDEMDNACE